MRKKLKKGCSNDIRLQTSLVIERNGEYLVGVSGAFQRWSNSPYDAWKTRRKDFAHKVAWAVKGDIVLFNPIVGQLKVWRLRS